jgi:hypothetical protein
MLDEWDFTGLTATLRPFFDEDGSLGVLACR